MPHTFAINVNLQSYVMIYLSTQKVKELTYMHSEGILAGELKHGPLALIDEAMPLLMVVVRDPVYKVTRYSSCCFFFN